MPSRQTRTANTPKHDLLYISQKTRRSVTAAMFSIFFGLSFGMILWQTLQIFSAAHPSATIQTTAGRNDQR